jgi:hypothetical protein
VSDATWLHDQAVIAATDLTGRRDDETTRIARTIEAFARDYAQGLEHRRQVWTKTPPTKPGWYWARAARGMSMEGEIMPVRVYDFALRVPRVEVPGWDAGADIEAFDLWAGPIEAQPLPKDAE